LGQHATAEFRAKEGNVNLLHVKLVKLPPEKLLTENLLHCAIISLSLQTSFHINFSGNCSPHIAPQVSIFAVVNAIPTTTFLQI
jgi:hypothetical protein